MEALNDSKDILLRRLRKDGVIEIEDDEAFALFCTKYIFVVKPKNMLGELFEKFWPTDAGTSKIMLIKQQLNMEKLAQDKLNSKNEGTTP
jgi:hypothetical protein